MKRIHEGVHKTRQSGMTSPEIPPVQKAQDYRGQSNPYWPTSSGARGDARRGGREGTGERYGKGYNLDAHRAYFVLLGAKHM